MPTIRKAIIPVAGIGTRLLPATKAQPKEMLTVVDKPVIQYIVEEAVAAGITEIIFVTSIGKRALEDHFDRNFELEYRLRQKGKTKELEEISRVGRLAKFAFVRQQKPLGDGHAILSAIPFIDEHEPVAVLFGDDIIDAPVPGIGQLMKTFERYNDPVVAVERVPKTEISRYGVIGGTRVAKGVYEVSTLVEKPAAKDAPSDLGVIGRYIITPAIVAILKKQRAGIGGEIRLADAFATALKKGLPLYAREIEGARYDCGNKLQFLEAAVMLGLKHPEVNGKFRKFLRTVA